MVGMGGGERERGEKRDVPAMRDTLIFPVLPWNSVMVIVAWLPYAQSLLVMVNSGCLNPCVRYGGI